MSKIQCGGFEFDDSVFEMTEINGKKALTVGGGVMTNGADAIILHSSTPESVKQFKITVTDDGQLTATEVSAEG